MILIFRMLMNLLRDCQFKHYLKELLMAEKDYKLLNIVDLDLTMKLQKMNLSELMNIYGELLNILS